MSLTYSQLAGLAWGRSQDAPLNEAALPCTQQAWPAAIEHHLCTALELVLGGSGEHNSICAHVASSARDRAEIVT